MAFHIAIAGDFNTGKSFSRKPIINGEECFLITPTAKASHLFTSEGKPVKRLEFKTENNPYTRDLIKRIWKEEAPKKKITDLMKYLMKTPDKAASITVEGNYVVATLEQVSTILRYISDYMPHIKNVFIGDFTHFLTHILASSEFIERKQGGEAYQRFWELAGQVVRDLIESSNDLREDMVIITEYHTAYDEVAGLQRVFVPGGQMLTEKFKLESYYDYMLFSMVEMDEKSKRPSRYVFVTERYGQYNARFSNIFEEVVIANDMQLVLSKFREYVGI